MHRVIDRPFFLPIILFFYSQIFYLLFIVWHYWIYLIIMHICSMTTWKTGSHRDQYWAASAQSYSLTSQTHFWKPDPLLTDPLLKLGLACETSSDHACINLLTISNQHAVFTILYFTVGSYVLHDWKTISIFWKVVMLSSFCNCKCLRGQERITFC